MRRPSSVKTVHGQYPASRRRRSAQELMPMLRDICNRLPIAERDRFAEHLAAYIVSVSENRPLAALPFALLMSHL